MDKLTLTFERDLEMGTEVSALQKATMELEHGNEWPTLVNDFVAFLRGTGYHIETEWENHYLELSRKYRDARLFMGEDAVGYPADGDGDATITVSWNKQPKSKPAKKTKKKKKAKAKR